jgi:tetratricopeptide (TPR) repeat protein
MMLRTLTLLAAAGALCFAQTPPANTQQRDLKIEKEPESATTSAPKPPSIPRSYALIIGIAKYQNLPANLQLNFSERDAEAIYSILISPEGGNFKAENVHKLVGPKATLANVKREIEVWLPSVAKPDDRVLIYFAGHGFVYQGQGYLAVYDFDMKNIAGTGYPMQALGHTMGGVIQAKNKVLLTDSCHSGAISPEDSASVNRMLSDLHRSLFSLTASRDRERSFESADWGGGHGIFTYYVVKGMEGAADTSGDGIVTADELADYVRTQVRQATNGQQNPTSDRGSFDPNMLLAYVPSNAKPGAPPAPKFGTLVFEVNMDGTEIFVNGKSVGVVNKGKPLTLPGLPPGAHTVKAVRMGYEPDGPREETVYPGQESTVTIKILIPVRRKKAAMDELDDGLKFYQKGYAQNYKKAVEHFEKALSIEPRYSQAAFYLGLTYNALYEQEKAQEYYKKAIEIDPDYLEAHANYGGMLLDIGNVDEAIRQFNIVLQRDPKHTTSLTLIAQAYRLKELYPQSIEAARAAIKTAPKSAEPHMWLAESLRLSGKYDESKREYEEYLRLSDFDSKLAGQLNYYVLGYLVGMGRKKRAAQQDIWRDLRSLAYFGMCDAERKLNRFDQAIEYCTRSLIYDPKDPYSHYALGLSYFKKAVTTNSFPELEPALKHFRAALEINADMVEAQYARQNIALIEKVRAQHN